MAYRHIAYIPEPLPIPDFPALLKVLDDRGIRIDVDNEGQLQVDAPAGAMLPEIRMQVRRYRDLLVWTIRARATGHTWAPCTVCRVPMLIAHDRTYGKRPGRPCALTPGCTGYHRHSEEGDG